MSFDFSFDQGGDDTIKITDDMTIGEYRELVRRYHRGEDVGCDLDVCAICTRTLKCHPYALTPTIVDSLVWLYQKAQLSPSRTVSTVTSNCPKWILKARQYSLLKFWGFVERVQKSEYRVTSTGVLFLRGEISVHNQILVFYDELKHKLGKTVSIHNILGSDFHYQDANYLLEKYGLK